MRLKYHNFSKKGKLAVLLTLIYFAMMVFYINEPFFASDEGDVYLMGASIANGKLLYRDITSQHMPVMYYIAAIFSLLGASTVTAYRLWFYFFMAAMWGLMYYRYSDKISSKILILFPALYIVMLGTIPMGYAVLSDQIQGIGMAILLFELLLFEEHRELKTGNLVMISLAVFISFGSAFVAAFAVFFVFLTVVFLEIHRYYRMKLSLVQSLRKLVVSYWKLVAFVAAPFAVLAVFYLVTGTLDDFYSWAYLINRTVYPQYLTYGGNILDSMFAGVTTIFAALTLPIAGTGLQQVFQFIAVAAAVYFFVYIQKTRKNLILTVGIALFWIGSATRGLFSYHGTPAMSLLCIMIAFAVVDIVNRSRESTLKLAVLCVVLLSFSGSYINTIMNFAPLQMLRSFKISEYSASYVIDLLTEDAEVVGFSTLNTNYIFESHTTPSKLNATCPWIWDWAGEEDLQQCKDNPPRVFVYDPDTVTWGYAVAEHAAPVHAFITGNYTPLTEYGYQTLYVRNDYFDEAIRIIEEDHKNRTGHAFPKVSLTVDEETNYVQVVLDSSVAYRDVVFSTWSDVNGQDDLLDIDAIQLDADTWAFSIDMDVYQSSGTCRVHIYVAEDGLPYVLKELSFVIQK